MVLTLCLLGNYSCLSSADFFSIFLNILSGLIWVQTVCMQLLSADDTVVGNFQEWNVQICMI